MNSQDQRGQSQQQQAETKFNHPASRLFADTELQGATRYTVIAELPNGQKQVWSGGDQRVAADLIKSVAPSLGIKEFERT